MKKPPEPMQTIGYLEMVSFPEWQIEGILAKSDTGARSSAIDVRNVEELEGGRVRFEMVIRREEPEVSRWVEATVVRRTSIKSSFGRSKDRLMVRTTVRVGDVEKVVELGLVSRKNMTCRMLLGRTTLRRSFLVNSGKTFMLGGRPAPKPRKKKEPSL